MQDTRRYLHLLASKSDWGKLAEYPETLAKVYVAQSKIESLSDRQSLLDAVGSLKQLQPKIGCKEDSYLYHRTLGRAYTHLRVLERAEAHYELALADAETVALKVDLLVLQGGFAYWTLGLPRLASKRYEAALNVAKHEDRPPLPAIWANLGVARCALDFGEVEKAHRHMEEAQRILDCQDGGFPEQRLHLAALRQFALAVKGGALDEAKAAEYLRPRVGVCLEASEQVVEILARAMLICGEPDEAMKIAKGGLGSAPAVADRIELILVRASKTLLGAQFCADRILNPCLRIQALWVLENRFGKDFSVEIASLEGTLPVEVLSSLHADRMSLTCKQ